MHRNHLPVDNYLDTPLMSAKLCTCLTPMLRSNRIAGPVGIAQALCLVLLASLLSNLTVAHASANDGIKYKAFAYSLLDVSEYSYFSMVVWHESRWSPSAHNHGHYGLCQGESIYLKTANYKHQILWCIKYGLDRYGSMRMMYEHQRRYGWQ